MILTKDQLKVLVSACAVVNPKVEIEYIQVDGKNAVATDTRRLAIFEHGQEVQGVFYVHGEVARQALKVKGGESFELSDFNIKILDKDNVEIMSMRKFSEYVVGYPDYTRISGGLDFKNNVQIAEIADASGVFAMNKIVVDKKLLPQYVNKNYEKEMFVRFTDPALPVSIDCCRFKYIIMPIVGIL